MRTYLYVHGEFGSKWLSSFELFKHRPHENEAEHGPNHDQHAPTLVFLHILQEASWVDRLREGKGHKRLFENEFYERDSLQHIFCVT